MLYRLVKKHIAGTTMSAAISKVIDLNKKNFPTSVTFLSGAVDTKAKAKYITSTYLELIRRLSRLGLKASIHIKSEQLGILLDEDSMLNNFDEILTTGNKYGVFIWLELPNKMTTIAEKFNGAKGYGLAFHEREALDLLKYEKRPRSTKILFEEHHGSSKTTKKNKKIHKNLEKLTKTANNLVLSSPPEHLIREILSPKSKYKNNIVLEFKLGYSSKKLKNLLKKNKKIIINVPFGKDWEEFAMHSVPEGYMRFLANSLLSEKKEK